MKENRYCGIIFAKLFPNVQKEKTDTDLNNLACENKMIKDAEGIELP